MCKDKKAMNYPTDEVIFQTIELELLKVNIVKYVTQEFAIHHLKLSSRQDDFLRAMVLKLEGHVLSENLERYEIEYPKDWWQAFKERWFPERLLEKYPVVYTQEIIDLKVLYPRLKVSLPEQQRTYRLEKWIGTVTK